MIWIDKLAARWLRRRGYSIVETSALVRARKELMDVAEYVDKSGHLNTVSGRRPRAIRRIRESLASTFVLSEPARIERDNPLLRRRAA